MPVFPHGRDRGQCLSFQVESVSQEAQNRDELYIDKQGSGRWKTISQPFLQHHKKKWNIKKMFPSVHWLQYPKKSAKKVPCKTLLNPETTNFILPQSFLSLFYVLHSAGWSI